MIGTVSLAFCIGAFTPELAEVQRRRASNARAAFAAAVQDPLLKSAAHSPLDLAALICSEERCADPFLRPSHVAESIRSSVEQIVTPAAKRISLTRTLGDDVCSKAITTAVAATLFGVKGAPDARDGEGFFSSQPQDALDCLDPQNLYLDTVLTRQCGVPLATSLIAAEACAQMDVPMVGLRSLNTLLLAPLDGSSFVLDCFRGGQVLSDDEAAAALAERTMGTAVAVEQLQQRGSAQSVVDGTRQLAAMRCAPMTALQWGAEILRELKEMHEESGDCVRLLGACDRLRMIGAHSRLAVSNEEMRECAGQLALCIHRLGWTQRRNEARALLHGILRSYDETVGAWDPDEPARIQSLLDDPWFAEA